jgi:hypothetical protein
VPNERVWHLSQETRLLASRQQQSHGLWDDANSKNIQQRYLRPHAHDANELLRALTEQSAQLDEVVGAVHATRAEYEVARLAGDEVVDHLRHAEYAVSITHDSIRRAMTFENRAAELEAEAIAAAQSAGASCDGIAGDRGQGRVGSGFVPIAPRAAAAGRRQRGGHDPHGRAIGAALGLGPNEEVTAQTDWEIDNPHPHGRDDVGPPHVDSHLITTDDEGNVSSKKLHSDDG